MTTVIVILTILLIIGVCVWFYFKNRKPNPPQPIPDSGETPSSGDTEPDAPEPVDTGDTEPIDSGDTPDTGDTEPTCIADSETHKIQDAVPYFASAERTKIGWYDTENICDGEWSVNDSEGINFLSDIKFEDGDITAVVSDTNYGEERTTRYITHLSGENVSKDDFFDVTQASAVDDEFTTILDAFRSEADVKVGSETYNYLKKIYCEAKAQYYGETSANGIPALYKEANFPNIYNFYGDNGDETSSFKCFAGWLFSLVLSELKPNRRVYIFKIGYEMGGYDRYSNIYGYKFKCDPNVARLVASSLYVSMRGLKKPNVDSMRKEIGGSKYNNTLYDLRKTDKESVGDDDFYTDFRQFMPTAPGPYAPGYSSRPDVTYPNEKKDEKSNLLVDREIHEMVVKDYNLDEAKFYEKVVQAIADEEACTYHLFGDNVTVDNYKFHPVFGVDTIGRRFNGYGKMADFAFDSLKASSSSRTILQSKDVFPKQYGRLRPGCSWSQEGVKNSATDDRRNALCDIDIEDNDGCKDSSQFGYYTSKNQWVYTQAEEDAFCEAQKNSLYANSYPSGHSSGIQGAGMVLMELMPELSDKILRALNQFAVNRTIARYHWNSDTVNGRVLGGATNAVAHAASDYDARLEEARKELENPSPEPTPTPTEKVNLTLSYAIGGYGSCHCDSGEQTITHNCKKQADTDRHPSINVSQKVEFTIEGAGMKTVDGKTSGTWETNKNYELICPAVGEGEEKTAKITMRNDNGIRILYYKLCRCSTHDDGAGSI